MKWIVADPEHLGGMRVKVIRVALPQLQGPEFTGAFIRAFERSDWSAYTSGSDWPGSA